jgi:hypothetical protein
MCCVMFVLLRRKNNPHTDSLEGDTEEIPRIINGIEVGEKARLVKFFKATDVRRVAFQRSQAPSPDSVKTCDLNICDIKA